jgi:hypothetical protein
VRHAVIALSIGCLVAATFAAEADAGVPPDATPIGAAVAAVEQGNAPAQAPARPRGGRVAAPPAGRRAAPPADAATPAAAEALFHRYVVRQARTALQLTPAQMRIFEPRLRHLQTTRQRVQRQRQRLLNELAAATRGGPVDEAALAERLQAFETFRASSETDLRDALAAVDDVLSVEQRARFRIFERRIERQKLELLERARREAAPQRPTPTAPAPTPAP